MDSGGPRRHIGAMSDDPISAAPVDDSPEAVARRASAAKQRHFAIGLFRLSGALIVTFGIAISLHRFDWVQGDKAKWLGLIVSIVGMLQFVIVPRMLARAWATPRPRP
jgi:uncharacterized membrane protein YcjF (UPF0283 family)